jgi:hypothetical protein
MQPGRKSGRCPQRPAPTAEKTLVQTAAVRWTDSQAAARTVVQELEEHRRPCAGAPALEGTGCSEEGPTLSCRSPRMAAALAARTAAPE